MYLWIYSTPETFHLVYSCAFEIVDLYNMQLVNWIFCNKYIYIFDTQSFLYAYIRTGNNNFESMFRIEFIFNQIEMESDSFDKLYLIINHLEKDA